MYCINFLCKYENKVVVNKLYMYFLLVMEIVLIVDCLKVFIVISLYICLKLF